MMTSSTIDLDVAGFSGRVNLKDGHSFFNLKHKKRKN
jgi:hypothetical protein